MSSARWAVAPLPWPRGPLRVGVGPLLIWHVYSYSIPVSVLTDFTVFWLDGIDLFRLADFTYNPSSSLDFTYE